MATNDTAFKRPRQKHKMSQLDQSLFIAADGFRSSVHWKVRKYERAGPLSSEQINSISAKFDLEAGDLRKLSVSLGIALHPTQNLISISRSRAAARAAKELQHAHKDVETAVASVKKAIRRLECLTDLDELGSDGRPQQIPRLLKASLAQLNDAHTEIEALCKSRQPPLLIAPDDKRHFRDHRRELVVKVLLHFWADAGRKLTFTTDPLTSERRGALIDFVNAVILCVTDPPAALKAETIVAEIRAFRPEELELMRKCIELFGKSNRDT
jgi:hypothetical protein